MPLIITTVSANPAAMPTAVGYYHLVRPHRGLRLRLAVAGFFIANQVLASSARVEESFGTALPGQPEAIAPTDMPIQGRAS